CLGGLLTMV
nr:Chain C, Latent membrane protein 2 [Human herpesvirus 4 strain B95-8]3REW_F Chain F, Latent membrane protein 2 [Human herpesvirus 4 strain B95-8]